MKTVLIFGSTGSLGHALVKKFLENGFFVIGISKSQDFFKNDNYCFISLDVLKYQDYSNLLNTCIGKDIEFCINTIGCYSNKFLQDLDYEEIRHIISINFITGIFIIKLLLMLFPINKVKHFIYVSSTGKGKIKEGSSLYSSSKLGLSTFMDCMALELKEKNILVTEFCPGPFESRIFEKGGSFLRTKDFPPLPSADSIADILIDYCLSSKNKFISKLVLHRNFTNA